jgi:rhodanese-related sulfurtransferase
MISTLRAFLLTTLLLAAVAACGDGSSSQADQAAQAGQAAPTVSGRIENGLRVLTIDAAATDQHFVIYRGDYVRPEWSTGGALVLEIPSLGVSQGFPPAEGERGYFKVPDAGSFPFTAGGASGVIEAIEYVSASYSELGGREAADFIAAVDPLILDVRTGREFADGHLEGAVLIPVQELQRRMGELAGSEQRPVLVYCRTGNRSTVAAKLLVDAGFTRVANMRRGVVDWARQGLPLQK